MTFKEIQSPNKSGYVQNLIRVNAEVRLYNPR